MILVTGGTGFIGRRLVPRLLEAGHRVRLIRRSDSSSAVPPEVEVVQGDLADCAAAATATAGVVTVVHLAGLLPGPGVTAARLHQVNVQATRALAIAAQQSGIRRFVQMSSAGVYGRQPPPRPILETAPLNPRLPYERAKADAERALLAAWGDSDGELVLLRPAGIFGPGREDTRRFFLRVLDRRIWLHGPAPHTVHPTYVEDVVQAVLLALTVPVTPSVPEIFNIGGERGLNLPDLAAFIAQRAGRRLRLVRLPVPKPLAPQGTHRLLDLTRARTILGYVPTPLAAAVDATLERLREDRRS